MKRYGVLLKNELKLNIRDMNMVIFAIAMPLAVLVVLGLLYGAKPAFPGADYTFLEQSFGAICTISICAGGLMGLPLVVSEYREKKILKRFHVTPVSPTLLLGVELTIYMLYCAVSLVTLAVTARLVWGMTLRGSAAGFLASWLLTMVSTLSIGLLVGGLAKNAKQAGVMASLMYFPMLLFSGTTVPVEVMPGAMQKIVAVFPLNQGIRLMKASFLGLKTEALWLPVLVMLAVTAVCAGIAVRYFKWESAPAS